MGWFIKLSVQTFQPLILLYRRGNFVYHHWRSTSIFRPLSYPFRSLIPSPLYICFVFFFAFMKHCELDNAEVIKHCNKTIIKRCNTTKNGFIITWILHQIVMFSNKVKHAAGFNNNSSISPFT